MKNAARFGAGWVSSRPAPALALSACALFLFWPLLSQPFIRDDLYIQWTLRGGDWRALLQRCLLPHYFRPLAAPVFLLLHALFGNAPGPLRALIVLLNAGTAFLIFRVARRISSSAACGFMAGCLYAFSAVHWDNAAMTSNLPQAFAHALFWLSLRLLLEDEGGDLLKSLLPVTIGLLFKEDVLVFPLFVLALSLFTPHLRQRLNKLCLVFSLWTAAYLGGRLLLPGSFLSRENHFRASWARLLDLGAFERGQSLLLTSWRHLLPEPNSFADLASLYRSSPLAAALWTAAALGLGAWLGWTLACGQSSPAGLDRAKAARLAVFSLAGAAAGMLPYIPFGAVQPWDAHRLALSCAALSIGLGALAWSAGRRLAAPGRRLERLCAAAGAFLFLNAALAYRFPRPGRPHFARLVSLYEARQLERCLEPGRNYLFSGFDPDEQPALRLGPGAGAPWKVERQAGRGRIRLIMSSGGARNVCAWPDRPALL